MTTVENKVAQLVMKAKVVNDTFENAMEDHTGFPTMKAKVDEFDATFLSVCIEPYFYLTYDLLKEEYKVEIDKCLCICATIHNMEGVGNFENLSEFAEPFKKYFNVDVDHLMEFLETLKRLN